MSILTEKAMLARHVIRRKDFRKFDREISEEVARQHGSDPEKAGRYNKVLIAREYLSKINSVASAAYAHHIANTLPWEDWGSRILPAEHYFRYMEAQRTYREQFNAAVREFIDNYPAYVEEAKKRLNGMFRASDYPPVSELHKAFEIDINVTPIPDAGDFRVSLSAQEKRRLEKKLEERMGKVLRDAIADLWNRLHESIRTLADRLEKYEEAERKVFFKSWIENVRAVVDLIPALNIANDQNLEDIRKKAESTLLRYEAETLKENVSARREVSDAANDILAAMAGYIGQEAA